MTQTNMFNTILQPKGIAVVGASRSPHKVGYQVFHNIIESSYKGQLFPVNPKARTILDHQAYPTLHALPMVPELVVIVTPATLVPVIIEECNILGVKAAIVISAGFAEAGSSGQMAHEQLTQLVSPGNTRILGPNCLGCFSTIHRLNATFGPPLPEKGSILLISQSGAMVTGVLDWARVQSIGIAHAITLGNRIDLGELEALEFGGSDPHTSQIMCYLESFQDAHTFFSMASKIAKEKPILLLKGGQSKAGIIASQSHTAALASDSVLVTALAEQTGVFMADDIESWFSMAALMQSMPRIRGNDVAVITNAGGPGVVSTDIASEEQLDIEPLTEATRTALTKELALINPHNPLDLLGDALPEAFQTAYRIVSSDTRADVTLIIITPQTTTNPTKTARLLIGEIRKRNKPCSVILIGGTQMEKAYHLLDKAHIPVYHFPHKALELISSKMHYDKKRSSLTLFPARSISPLSQKQKDLFTKGLQAQNLSLEVVFKILTAYSIRVPEYMIIDKISHVSTAFKHVGTPAVIKTANLDLAHKAVLGGVFLSISRQTTARHAFSTLMKLGSSVLFQKMVSADVEIIIGARRDPVLGPFLTVGLGGGMTNLLSDRSYVFIPAADTVIFEQYRLTKAFQLIEEKGLSHQPVIQTMKSLGQLLLDFEFIEELEINPLLVTDKFGWAADIKVVFKEND